MCTGVLPLDPGSPLTETPRTPCTPGGPWGPVGPSDPTGIPQKMWNYTTAEPETVLTHLL